MLKPKKIIRFLFVMLFLFMCPGRVAMCVNEEPGVKEEVVAAEEAKTEAQESEQEFYIDEEGILTAYNGQNKDVVIPTNVKKIAFGVFMEHDEIESVAFPHGLDYIDEYAFYGCDNLKEVLLPESVVSIGRLAFGNCKSLEIAYIGEKVSEMGEFIFWGCDKLYCISVSDDNRKFAAIDGILYSKDIKKLIYCPEGYEGEVFVSDETNTIGAYAFFNCYKIKKVTIGKNVVYIDEGAFYGCKNLEEIIFGAKVKKIRSAAFEKCAKLKQMQIPKTVTFVGNSAFAECESLQKIEFLNKKTEIAGDMLSKGAKTLIVGSDCSTAQKYAKNSKLKFEKV